MRNNARLVGIAVVAGLLLAGMTVSAIDIKTPNLNVPGVTSGPASDVVGKVAGAGLEVIKACCDQVRYTNKNIVRPKEAIAKMDSCTKGFQSKMDTNETNWVKTYWNDSMAATGKCIYVQLSCDNPNYKNSSETGNVCGSCTAYQKSPPCRP